MTSARVLIRSVVVIGRFVVVGSSVAIARLWKPLTDERFLNYAGRRLASAFQSLGGAYVKLGQILATRQDLFPPEFLAPLERLQDDVRPFSGRLAEEIARSSLGGSLASFDRCPIASASIAQVHRASLSDVAGDVVVKIKRPKITRLIAIDVKLLTHVVKPLARLPALRGIPVREAVDQICAVLAAQADFSREAEMHLRFQSLFQGDRNVKIPHLIRSLCSTDVLVMEFVPDAVRFSDPKLSASERRAMVRVGLRALFRMLFSAGLVHCDLHPGNILGSGDGKAVVLDFGFVSQLVPRVRRAFAEFFLSIAFGDGPSATRIVLETAAHVPEDLDADEFESHMSDLIAESSRLRASEFLVAGFVQSLFQIQRKHRIYGTPDFSLAILSLLVFEGTVRRFAADLDFQREAVPFVLAALE